MASCSVSKNVFTCHCESLPGRRLGSVATRQSYWKRLLCSARALKDDVVSRIVISYTHMNS
jgi:hypothetical protein